MLPSTVYLQRDQKKMLSYIQKQVKIANPCKSSNWIREITDKSNTCMNYRCSIIFDNRLVLEHPYLYSIIPLLLAKRLWSTVLLDTAV